MGGWGGWGGVGVGGVSLEEGGLGLEPVPREGARQQVPLLTPARPTGRPPRRFSPARRSPVPRHPQPITPPNLPRPSSRRRSGSSPPGPARFTARMPPRPRPPPAPPGRAGPGYGAAARRSLRGVSPTHHGRRPLGPWGGGGGCEWEKGRGGLGSACTVKLACVYMCVCGRSVCCVCVGGGGGVHKADKQCRGAPARSIRRPFPQARMLCWGAWGGSWEGLWGEGGRARGRGGEEGILEADSESLTQQLCLPFDGSDIRRFRYYVTPWL